MPVAGQVCVHPSCSPRQHASSVLSRRPPARWNTAMRATYVALLHGSSLRFGLCYPKPSSLNRPDPPHLQAQHNFIALRLICPAFAVAGALRQPATGSALSSVDPSQHVILYVPGEPPVACIQFLHGAHLPSPESPRLGTPNVGDFGAYLFTDQTDPHAARPAPDNEQCTNANPAPPPARSAAPEIILNLGTCRDRRSAPDR